MSSWHDGGEQTILVVEISHVYTYHPGFDIIACLTPNPRTWMTSEGWREGEGKSRKGYRKKGKCLRVMKHPNRPHARTHTHEKGNGNWKITTTIATKTITNKRVQFVVGGRGRCIPLVQLDQYHYSPFSPFWPLHSLILYPLCSSFLLRSNSMDSLEEPISSPTCKYHHMAQQLPSMRFPCLLFTHIHYLLSLFFLNSLPCITDWHPLHFSPFVFLSFFS